MAVRISILSGIWQLDRWLLSEIWQLKVIFLSEIWQFVGKSYYF